MWSDNPISPHYSDISHKIMNSRIITRDKSLLIKCHIANLLVGLRWHIILDINFSKQHYATWGTIYDPILNVSGNMDKIILLKLSL